MSDMYVFNNPWTYKNDWYVFPDTVLSHIDLSDCNNSINGTCQTVKTLSECINKCESNIACKNGYYIETPDKKNICVPLLDRGVSPHYRIRHKNYYSETKNLKPYIFAKKTYPYPPDDPNTIYYSDHFIMENNGKSLSKIATGDTYDDVDFIDDYVSIQFLPSDITNDFIENYIMVKNGDQVTINIPSTSFVLRQKEDTNDILWSVRASSSFVQNNTFQVFSANSSKKLGEALNYSESFYITMQGKPIFYDKETKKLVINSEGEKSIFKLIPRVEVSYCDGNRCRKILLSETQMDGFKARYKNQKVYRSPMCWNRCSRGKKHVLFMLVFVLIIVACIIAYLR